MSILRGIGKFFGGLIFTIFLISSVVVFSVVQLIEYNSLKSVFTSLLVSQFPKEELGNMTQSLRSECLQRDSIQIPFQNQTFTVNCNEIQRASDENITSIFLGNFFNNIYYKNYDCEFIECLQNPGKGNFFVLFSASAYKFFGNIQFALWTGVALGAVLLFVSTETWDGRLKGFGACLIITGLPFVIIGQVKNFVFSMLPAGAGTLNSLIDKIFGPMSTNFLIILIAGIALTVGGYAISLSRRKGSKKK